MQSVLRSLPLFLNLPFTPCFKVLISLALVALGLLFLPSHQNVMKPLSPLS